VQKVNYQAHFPQKANDDELFCYTFGDHYTTSVTLLWWVKFHGSSFPFATRLALVFFAVDAFGVEVSHGEIAARAFEWLSYAVHIKLGR
jgi:hypothetical protein